VNPNMEYTKSDGFVDSFGVDFTQPLFAQIDDLGDRYFEWVHTPSRRRF
jgi:hypothetical protein